MKIGLFCNKKRDEKTMEAKKLARKAEAYLKKNGQETFFDLSDKIAKKLDLAILFGGDGLILYAANRLAPYKVPIFRVNFGIRGFLTNIEPADIFSSLEEILNGDYHIEERNRITAEVFYGNKVREKIDALNEIAIGGINRTVYLRMEVWQKYKIFTAETYGDGLLVSTKTGSTAYNMNAGGATLLTEDNFSIVSNNGFFRSESLKMHIKSFVAAADSEFRIQMTNRNKLNLPFVVADGQRGYKLKKEDCVIIKNSLTKTLFMEIGKDKK